MFAAIVAIFGIQINRKPCLTLKPSCDYWCFWSFAICSTFCPALSTLLFLPQRLVPQMGFDSRNKVPRKVRQTAKYKKLNPLFKELDRQMYL
jgi:hypothetical protein